MDLKQIGVPAGHIKKLAAVGIESVEELLEFKPKSYLDCQNLTGISAPVSVCTSAVLIQSVNYYPKSAGGKSDLILASCREIGTGLRVQLSWFNQTFLRPHIEAMLRHEVLIAGKPTYDAAYGVYKLTPTLFVPATADAMKIYPQYRKLPGISASWLEEKTEKALSTCKIEETLPQDILQRYSLPATDDTLRMLHHPTRMEEVDIAKRRLLMNDLIRFSLHNEQRNRSQSAGSQYNVKSMTLYQRIRAGLPFELTADQDKALSEILALAKDGRRLNGLIQGDVGSGKTIVAELAAAAFVDSGYQVAVLAPTQILAGQHYRDFQKLFEPYGVEIAYVDGAKVSKETRENISTGKASIVIGTHAILGKNISFAPGKLALTIVDEEHKFGVEQRKKLLSKAEEGVHALSMSATPIPRSLATTLYGGSVQLFNIQSMPSNRKPLITGVAKSREKVYTFLKSQATKGYQAYIVCPMIDPNDELETVDSVEETYAAYKAALPELSIEKLTGQTPKDEAEKIIKDFVDGAVSILVATTIVEVGVNVPNATVIVIESADRFGLSTLHQLRGRVGRGEAQGYCVLESAVRDGIAGERLQTMCDTSNGFEIAEKDLKLRGPGEIFGTRQSGVNRFLDLALAYPNEYRAAQEIARDLLDRGTDCCLMTKKIVEEKLDEIA